MPWRAVIRQTAFDQRGATITGARTVSDPAATNAPQIVISGTRRTGPQGAVSMPEFASIFSDTEIAAVVNYVTSRFRGAGSSVNRRTISRVCASKRLGEILPRR